MRWSDGLWEVLGSDWRVFWVEMHFLRRDRWSGYFRESDEAEGLMPTMGIKLHWISAGLNLCSPPMLNGSLLTDPIQYFTKSWHMLHPIFFVNVLDIFLNWKDNFPMAAYKFYYMNENGDSHLVGILPERRRHPRRITHQSIMNWWGKVAGHIPMQEGHRIHFDQVDI